MIIWLLHTKVGPVGKDSTNILQALKFEFYGGCEDLVDR